MTDFTAINERINNEFCENTYHALSDEKLIDEYKQCISVKNNIQIILNILEKHNINDTTKNNIINDYLLKLIPAGTKGVIRGIKFNHMIKNKIMQFKLDETRFEISFEQMCKTHITHEIPDWYILEKETNKIIIGMNQLDLWSGGQQSNRGSKYLLDGTMNTDSQKLLCVVCNKITFKNTNTKAYKLFSVGYNNNTLCYLNGLRMIIMNFFG